MKSVKYEFEILNGDQFILAVMCNVWYCSAGAFWRNGHGREVKTLDITVGVEGVFEILRLVFESGLQLVKQFAHSWIYPAASARRHVLMSPAYKMI